MGENWKLFIFKKVFIKKNKSRDCVRLIKFSSEDSQRKSPNTGTVLTELLGCMSNPDSHGGGTAGSHHPVFAGSCATAVTLSGTRPRRAWHLGVLQRATLLLHTLRGQLPEQRGGPVGRRCYLVRGAGAGR